MTEIYLAKLKEIYNGYNCERIMVGYTAGTAGVLFLVEIISDWES